MYTSFRLKCWISHFIYNLTHYRVFVEIRDIFKHNVGYNLTWSKKYVHWLNAKVQEALRPIRFLNFINQNPELIAGIFWLRKTEIRNRDLGNKKSEIRNPKSESRKRKTEIRNQKSDSEIGNRKSETEIRNQKSKIRLSKGTWRHNLAT